MVSLYHRSLNVLRYYAYLGVLEKEIRLLLGFVDGEEMGFTRESSFYWQKRPVLMSLVKYFYILIIAGMLGLFFYLRILVDLYRCKVCTPAASRPFIYIAYCTRSLCN